MKRLFLFGTCLAGAIWARPAVADISASPAHPVLAEGGRYFFALIAGILLATAFQWVLTNFSIAAGIAVPEPQRSVTPLARRSGARQDPGKADPDPKDKPAQTGGKIGMLSGSWGIAAPCLALFLACRLALETAPVTGRWEAVALGLSIWAGFLVTMAGLSRLEKNFLDAPAGSLPAMLRGAGQSEEQATTPLLQAAAGSASVSDAQAVKEKFLGFVQAMPPRAFDRATLDGLTKRAIDAEMREAALQGLLRPLEKGKFEEMISARGDISREEARELADSLHYHWNETVSGARKPEIPEAPRRLGDPFPELSTASAEPEASTERGPEAFSPAPGPGGGTRTSPAGVSSRSQAFRDFLRKSDKRELNPARLDRELEIILSPDESGPSPQRALRELTRDDMAAVLRQRRDLTLQEADSIANLIESARARMLSRTERQEHRAQESMNQALSKVRDFVYSLKRPDPDYEAFQADVTRIFSDPPAGFETLQARLAGLDRQEMSTALAERGHFTREEAERLADGAEEAKHRLLEETARAEMRQRRDEAEARARESAQSARSAAAAAAWRLMAAFAGSAAAAALGGLAGRP
jgi:hypothetical protein